MVHRQWMRPQGPCSPRILALLALAALPVASQSVNCGEDAENPECCRLETGNSCIFKDVRRALDGCSIACQRRYQNLGWDCYHSYREHERWRTMAANCDPTSIVKFNPPSTTAGCLFNSTTAGCLFNCQYGQPSTTASTAAPSTTAGRSPADDSPPLRPSLDLIHPAGCLVDCQDDRPRGQVVMVASGVRRPCQYPMAGLLALAGAATWLAAAS